MAVIIDIADSVVAQINGATLSQPVVAARFYQPRFGVEEMQALHVSVVPRSITNKTLDRTHDTFDYMIDVAVQKRTDGSLGSLDALMNLVEEDLHVVSQPATLELPRGSLHGSQERSCLCTRASRGTTAIHQSHHPYL